MKKMVEKFGKKKVVVVAIVVIYLLGSLVYISTDLWAKFKANVMDSSYKKGITDIVQQVLTLAENKECREFPFGDGQKQVQLISTTCKPDYDKGKTEMVQQLLTQAENKECKPFPVYSGQKQIELINTTCLQKSTGENK